MRELSEVGRDMFQLIVIERL
jgi:hypothetical protein